MERSLPANALCVEACRRQQGEVRPGRSAVLSRRGALRHRRNQANLGKYPARRRILRPSGCGGQPDVGNLFGTADGLNPRKIIPTPNGSPDPCRRSPFYAAVRFVVNRIIFGKHILMRMSNLTIFFCSIRNAPKREFCTILPQRLKNFLKNCDRSYHRPRSPGAKEQIFEQTACMPKADQAGRNRRQSRARRSPLFALF